MLKNKLKNIYNGYKSWKYLKSLLEMSKKQGFSDVNDYLDEGADHMAYKAIKKLFEDHIIKIDSGTILEVGACTGRITREINKYVKNVGIVSLEIDAAQFQFLKKYIVVNKWSNVIARLGDYFNYDFKNEAFEMVIIPWFIQLSLYRWARALEIGSKITKANGYFIFDFIDSQDFLLDKINDTANAPHLLINGNDVEKIANHFGFIKRHEFNISFNGLSTKYFIYQKQY